MQKNNDLNLADLLHTLNQDGGFSISVLSDQQGFPLASAMESGQDPDLQAAVVALVQKSAVQATNQLGMAQTDEISLYSAGGQRLVCRLFMANEHSLILAVQIPDKAKSYRRLTNRAISAIQKSWKL